MREKVLDSLTFLASVSNEVPEGRVFALDGQTFIGVAIQIGNIFVLFAVLYWLLYKPVKKILADRTKRIEDQFQTMEAREEKARALIEEYEDKLSAIDEERQVILTEARREAEEEKRRMIANAEQMARKIKEDADKSLETERRLLHRNTKDYVLELSALLAEKTLKDSVNPEKQDEQFEDGLKELEAASWQD